MDLVKALLTVGASSLQRSTEDFSKTVTENVQRVGRVVGLESKPYGLPRGPSGDVALQLLSGPLPFLESLRSEYGKAVGLLVGGEWVLLVSDADLAREVMGSGSTAFVKKGTAFFPGSSLAGNGLLVSDGALWQRQRRLSNASFSRAAIARYSTSMLACTSAMLSSWGGKQLPGSSPEPAAPPAAVKDLYREFNELTLKITYETLFGGAPTGAASPAEGEVADAIRSAFAFFTQRAASGFVVPEWVPTPNNVQYSNAVNRLDRVVYRLIRDRREQLQEGKPGQDLLDSLLAARDEEGQGMTDKSLRDELMTMLIAGQETSAILLAWTATFVAAHPAVQERARAEVLEVVGSDRQPCAKDVQQLPYIACVLLEALRLRPPAYLVGRCAATDVQLTPSISLTKGTTVLVSPYLMHRDATVWEDAEQFQPERWSSAVQEKGGFMPLLSNFGPNGSYLPFGAGPRNCIGSGFAMMEGVLVLACLLQQFELLQVQGARGIPEPAPLITLRLSAAWLQVRRLG